MKDVIKSILGIGLTIGLSDREGFVKGVSDALQEYQDDPQKAEKWAKAIADYLEQVKNNINTDQVIKSAVSGTGMADAQKVAELTRAIEELTTELRTFKDTKR
jgi:hypothetical protein